ncbi:MAG: LPS assembly lipoprotein LptE [Saprospiraceae bacterium]
MQCLKFIFLLLVLSIILPACYTFSGISISDNVKSYYVARFKDNAPNAPPTLAQTLTNALDQKIRTEARLIENNVSPNIEFKGTLVDFRVTSEAPRPDETTALNRLTITTAIEYINNVEKDKGWKKNFSHFFDFPSSQDLSSVQDAAIEEITNQIMEYIFNEAFTDW